MAARQSPRRRLLVETVPRWFLGLLFLVAAIDGLFFLATGSHLARPPSSPAGAAFQEQLIAVGFFWPFMKVVELVGSLCLLTNRAPAFGLAILAPVMSVIVLDHLFLEHQLLPLGALIIIAGVLLIRAYAPIYSRLFDHGGGRG